MPGVQRTRRFAMRRDDPRMTHPPVTQRPRGSSVQLACRLAPLCLPGSDPDPEFKQGPHWFRLEATAPAEEALLARLRVCAHPRCRFRIIRSSGDKLPQRVRFQTGSVFRGPRQRPVLDSAPDCTCRFIQGNGWKLSHKLSNHRDHLGRHDRPYGDAGKLRTGSASTQWNFGARAD